MSKRKTRKPTVEEAKDLKYQLEDYVRQGVLSFEDLTGLSVVRIDVTKKNPIGFEAKPTIEIDVTTDF